MKQRVRCPVCGTWKRFEVECGGIGRVLEICPHCDWGWPADRPPARRVLRCDCGAELGPGEVQCVRCQRKAAAIKRGVGLWHATRDRAAYFRERQRAALKGWTTKRLMRGTG